MWQQKYRPQEIARIAQKIQQAGTNLYVVYGYDDSDGEHYSEIFRGLLADCLSHDHYNRSENNICRAAIYDTVYATKI